MTKNNKSGLNIGSYGNLKLLSIEEATITEGGASLFELAAEGVGFVAGYTFGAVVAVYAAGCMLLQYGYGQPSNPLKSAQQVV